MSLFAFIGFDGAEGAERRSAHRKAHLEHLDRLEAAGRIAFAGPLRNDTDDASVGAVILFEAADLLSARALVESDPYVVGGVFATVRVTPFRKAYPRS
jgi:hypothetical protein